MRAVVFAVLALIGFTVQSLAAPAITLKPNSGPPGTEVSIDGTGFGGAHAIDILFDGVSIGTVTADGSGAFSGKKVNVPAEAQPGKHVVTASDTVTLNFATKNFTVQSDNSQFHGDTPAHTGLSPYEDTINATNAASLGLLWQADIGQYGTTVTPVVCDGVAWITTLTGKFYGVDIFTGKILPGFPKQMAEGFIFDNAGRGSPVCTRKYEYAVSEGGFIFGWDKRGNQLPAYPIPLGDLSTGGALTLDSGSLYAGQASGILHAFNAGTGVEKAGFPFHANGAIEDAVAIDHQKQVGFFGTSTGNFYAVNLTNGQQLWMTNYGSPVTSTPSSLGGVVYFGDDAGNLRGVDEATGATVFGPKNLGGPIGDSPLATSAMICAGSLGKVIACFSRTTGKRIFLKHTLSDVWGSFMFGNGLIAANDLADVYVLSPTGVIVFQAPVAADETASPVFGNGRVLMPSTDGNLYAFGPNPPSAAASH